MECRRQLTATFPSLQRPRRRGFTSPTHSRLILSREPLFIPHLPFSPPPPSQSSPSTRCGQRARVRPSRTRSRRSVRGVSSSPPSGGSNARWGVCWPKPTSRARALATGRASSPREESPTKPAWQLFSGSYASQCRESSELVLRGEWMDLDRTVPTADEDVSSLDLLDSRSHVAENCALPKTNDLIQSFGGSRTQQADAHRYRYRRQP